MSKKSGSQAAFPPPRPLPSKGEVGFTIWITLRGGMSPQSEKVFDRRLSDYLDERDLSCSGTHLHKEIWSDERDLTEVDQVDLLVWLIEGLTPTVVEIGPLTRERDLPLQRGSAPVVRAPFSDMALIPMAWLYRAGRIDAQQVLGILGGFNACRTVH